MNLVYRICWLVFLELKITELLFESPSFSETKCELKPVNLQNSPAQR